VSALARGLVATLAVVATATSPAGAASGDGDAADVVAVTPPTAAVVALGDALERVTALADALGDPDDPATGVATAARAVLVAAGGDGRSPLAAAGGLLRRADVALSTIGPRTRDRLAEALRDGPAVAARLRDDLPAVTAMLDDVTGLANEARVAARAVRDVAPTVDATLGALRGGARRAAALDGPVGRAVADVGRLLDAPTVRGVADRQARTLRRARPGLRDLAALERRCHGVSATVHGLAGTLDRGDRFGSWQRMTVVLGQASDAIATGSDGCPR